MAKEITQLAGDEKFRQFDVVSDPTDHHFAGKQSKPTPPTSGPAQKKIMQEWKLLSKELPESIYVRVYETRVDLLRAAIVGARGTPYHDGLFFFDISFPSDYPARPPLVHYCSFGFRINPNLYANGRVCLSLLHTWSGQKCEKWDPRNSTILQVLLSIQALVLNERPYFNEPGYGMMSGKGYWEKKSLAYSEDVFVLNCKTMQWVLWKPPKYFEPLVKQHFKDRAEFILNACDMYRKGLVKVGLFNGIVNGGKGAVSSRFKSSLDKCFADLAKAFARTGAPVERYLECANKEKEAQENAAAAAKAAKKAKVSMAKRLRNILAGMFGKKKSKTSPVLDVSQDSGSPDCADSSMSY